MHSDTHVRSEAQFRKDLQAAIDLRRPWVSPAAARGSRFRELGLGVEQLAFDATPTALVQSGAIRAIAAGTATRMRALPNLPTLQEQGLKGFECYTWNAIPAPANTPSPIVVQLNEAMSNALADPAVFDRLQEVGIDPTPKSTPEQVAEFIKVQS